MSWINHDDVMRQLQAHGLLIDKPLAYDSRIQRWQVDGEGHEKRGWSRLKEWTSKAGHTYIVGCYGIWHGNDDGYTKIEMPARDDNLPVITDEDKAAIRAAQKASAEQVKKERAIEAKTAASWAASVWNKCAPCTEHEYLTRKGIAPHGVRLLGDLEGLVISGLDESNNFRLRSAIGALVVPMHDEKSNVCGLQFIYPKAHPRKQKIERDKEFWPSGMAMGGTFGVIGHVRRTGVLLVTEGYATAASLFEATGQSVAYAFSANNLVKAGKLLRKANPKLRLLFCADDDYLTKDAAGNATNPGVTAAVQASAEIEHAAWVKPDFTDADGNDQRAGKKLTDFNDLAILTGIPLTLANQINAKLDALNWRDTPARAITTGGGGDTPARPSMLMADDVVDRFSPVWSPEDVYYFDHDAHVVVTRQSITARMQRSGWDQVQANPRWQIKPEVPIEGVDFDPTNTDPDVIYNLWHGMPPINQPDGGTCTALLDLLALLCSHETSKSMDILDWVLRWLAYPLQNPGAKMQTCILMHGHQGAGKNTFFGAMLEIFGTEYSVEFGPAQLENRFNAVFSKKLFAIGNEVVASREDLYHVKGNIKHMITERRWVVEGKHKDQRWERNCCNFVFMSNEINPQALDKGDRRHLVIWTPPVPDPDLSPDEFATWKNMWQAAQEERRNGGAKALYQFLMALDLSNFSEATWPPMTAAKQDLIDLNMDSRERFWNLWINGQIEHLPPMPCVSEDLYEGYRWWVTRSGIARTSPLHTFIAFIGKQPNIRKAQERYKTLSGDYKKTIIFPPGMQDAPENLTRAIWIGNCVTDFRANLQEIKHGNA